MAKDRAWQASLARNQHWRLSGGNKQGRREICSYGALCCVTLVSRRQCGPEVGRGDFSLFVRTAQWLCGGDEGASPSRGQTKLRPQPFLPLGWRVLEKLRLSPHKSVCGTGPTGLVTASRVLATKEPGIFYDQAGPGQSHFAASCLERQNLKESFATDWK